MTFKTTKLRDAITFALVAGATAVAGTGVAFAQDADEEQASSQATTLDRIEVTGSRIKRAQIEGALPVTVIDRAAIEASGDVSVADFLRDTTFNSFGSYQTTSGSSWAGFSGISLRGLGEGRTLILIDGRRAPTAPQTGSSQNLNTIPLAAVERIEILSDGASAVYGSDALGGVVNIITRRDYEGAEIAYGRGFPSQDGGDTEEGHIIFGASGDRSRLLGGFSYNKRDVIHSRDRWYWTQNRSGSVYSNNITTNPSASGYISHPEWGSAVPGDCTAGTNLFYVQGSGPDATCQYDHAQTSANLTSVENKGVFVRADHQINDDWTVFFNGTVSQTESFGRYAPVPSSPFPGGAIRLDPGTPNHPGTIGGNNPEAADPYYQSLADTQLYLLHRFAALGTRDSQWEDTTTDFQLGFEGVVGNNIDVEFGVRQAESRARDQGSNYVVGGLAQAPITAGDYNIYDPMNNDPDMMKQFTATILRDQKTTSREIFGSAAFDLFQLPGGTAAMVVGAEYREDFYQDIYDPLSESGQIVGSAGNSSIGGRDVTSGYFEMLLPFVDTFEVNLAGRYDEYSDYGSDFAPKVSFRWHPLDNLTLRGSYGEGFRAPPLSVLAALPAFSAAAIAGHRPTCDLYGVPSDEACGSIQLTTYSIANPNLSSEQSEQLALGVVWDATDWLSMTLDYYKIDIDNSLTSIGAQGILNCLTGVGTSCPDGLSFFPAGTQVPNVSLGLGVTLDPATGGIVNAQTGSINLGTVETEGYDFTARTNFDFNNWGSLRNQFQLSYVSHYGTNGGLSFAGQAGYPRLRAALSNTWSMGDWSASWNISYIHRTQSVIYRQVVAADRAGNTANAAAWRGIMDEYGSHVPSWTTHDVQVSYDAPWNATVTLGVRNLMDKDPAHDPYYLTYAQTGDFDSYLYDPWGRVPYFRYVQRF